MAEVVHELDAPSQSKRKKKADAAALLKEIREAIEDAWDHERDNIKEAQQDLEFLAGNQWPDDVKRDRDAQGRPMLTVNKLPQFLRQVTNDIRQADLAIKTAPVDDESDPELAKVYDGILKQIQYQSSAKHVFSTAAEHQAGCGIGWFRVKTEYADDSAFDLEIRLEAIRNPLAVFCDPASVMPDRSDATWIAVTELIPKRTFKKRYPNAADSSLDVPSDVGTSVFWTQADDIRIAEYWHKVPVTKTLALLATGDTIDMEEIKGIPPQMLPPVVKTREVKTHRVESYIVSGSEILSGPHEWPGKYIPLVPVLGAELALEKKVYRYGVIRFAREPQQLYNYYRTASAEAMALAPKSPWLATPNMIGPFKQMWDNANRGNIPYLLYDPDPTAPGAMPQRQPPVQVNAAFLQEAQIAADDMKSTTGIYDASLGARSNETAGIAIRARQMEGDVANYHFIDNVKRSLEHAGRILIDLIPKVYDNQRVVRIQGDGDQEQFVKINHVLMASDGQPVVLNDLSTGRFDIRVTIGPNFATKRFEAANMMMEFVKAFPASAPLVADLVASMQDWPKSDEMAKRLRHTVPPQILHDPEDPKSPPPPDPTQDPMFQVQMAKEQAEIALKEAQVLKTQMEAAKLQAEGAPPQVIEPQVIDPYAQITAEAGARKAHAEATLAEIRAQTEARNFERDGMQPSASPMPDTMPAPEAMPPPVGVPPPAPGASEMPPGIV